MVVRMGTSATRIREATGGLRGVKAYPPFVVLSVVLLLVALFAVAGPAEAQEKSLDLPRSEVAAEVQPDGSVLVTERTTYNFTGHFEGGYREITLEDGMSVDQVSVSEGGEHYKPGASAELGSDGAPGTFGTANLGDRYRIVWHYRATDEQRTFEVRYHLRGLAVAYEDVVDVYLQVWGDEWQEPLDSLKAKIALPGEAERGEVKVFGHPASVDGETSLGSDGVSPHLTASDVPAGQFVEMRVVFPRELLSSTEGTRVESGAGLQKIMDEEAADARWTALWAWLPDLQLLLGLLLVILAAGMMGLVYVRYGREPKVYYDRKYEHEPPTDDPPAVVGAIMDQRLSVGTKEFAATLFDLVRRGVLKAEPVSVKKNGWLWGQKTITDLEIYHGEPVALTDYESEVMDVTKSVLADGPVLLSDFEDRIKDNAEMNSYSYERFQEAVKEDVEQRDLVERGPGRWLGPLALVLGLAGATWSLLSLLGLGPDVIRFFSSLGVITLLGILIVSVGLFYSKFIKGADSLLTAAWVRRTPKGALLHARWNAFRAYLKDFSRMEDAPPASLALWEKYLVYGIALGVAEDVLAAARLHAPPEVVEDSGWFPLGSDGDGDVFEDIQDVFSGALTLPSSGSSDSYDSGSSGSGGDFSGGGGDGGGGGGGGAW